MVGEVGVANVVGEVAVGNSGEKVDVGNAGEEVEEENAVGEAEVGNAGEVCVVRGFSLSVGGLLVTREIESEDTSTWGVETG